MTGTDIITAALTEIRVCSALQGPNIKDLALGLTRLNLIFDTWNLQTALRYFVPKQTINLAAGQIEYQIGPGGAALNAPRPLAWERIELRFLSQPNPVLDVRVISPQQFLDESQGTNIRGTPYIAGYNPMMPIGVLSFYPAPDQVYTADLYYQSGTFAQLPDAVTVFTLPPGYQKLIMLQLALESCPAYETQPNPMTVEAYKDALLQVQLSNQQKVVSYPDDRAPGQRRFWNGYTDQWR